MTVIVAVAAATSGVLATGPGQQTAETVLSETSVHHALLEQCGFRKFWPQFFRKFWHQADAPPVLEHPFGGDGEGAIPQEGEEDVGDAQAA